MNNLPWVPAPPRHQSPAARDFGPSSPRARNLWNPGFEQSGPAGNKTTFFTLQYINITQCIWHEDTMRRIVTHGGVGSQSVFIVLFTIFAYKCKNIPNMSEMYRNTIQKSKTNFHMNFFSQTLVEYQLSSCKIGGFGSRLFFSYYKEACT